MIALLQRVTEAGVQVDGEEVASIGQGLMILAGVEAGDTDAQADRLAERLLAYRVFADGEQRMNLDVTQIAGEVLLVPQFTLAADTARGNRPGFSTAAPPAEGRRLFDRLVEQVRQRYERVQTGIFGTDMKVRLINDGPVTFRLRVPPANGTGSRNRNPKH